MLPDPVRAYRHAPAILWSFMVYGPVPAVFVPIVMWMSHLAGLLLLLTSFRAGDSPASGAALLVGSVVAYVFLADHVLGPNMHDGKPHLLMRQRLVELYTLSLVKTSHIPTTISESREAALAIFNNTTGTVDELENYEAMMVAIQQSHIKGRLPFDQFDARRTRILASLPPAAMTSHRLPLD